MFKKKDFIIIFIIFVVIIGALLFNHFYFSQKAAYVKITVNNQVYRTVPLEIDQTIKISDKNMIVINHGSVHMKDATCPDKLCIKQGTISKNGEQIICLPNQVVIAIVSNQYNDVDHHPNTEAPMTKRITYLSLLIAIAIILGYLETFIPINFGIPGAKLGLANLIGLIALYRFGFRDALIITLLRVFIIASVFTNYYMFLYSLSGALLSLVIMVLLKKTKLFSTLIISISGAIFHNLGQILVALIFYGFNIIYYLPYLIILSLITGSVIGILGQIILAKLPKQLS